jgi:hypothetical protein
MGDGQPRATSYRDRLGQKVTGQKVTQVGDPGPARVGPAPTTMRAVKNWYVDRVQETSTRVCTRCGRLPGRPLSEAGC